jgi:hypothetical protein
MARLVAVVPRAQQAVVLGHETPRRFAVPLGSASDLQRLPPLWVASTTTESPPWSTLTAPDRPDTALTTPVGVLDTLISLELLPVTQQADELAHETPFRPSTLDGTFCSVHCLPESVVATRSALSEELVPTAQQSVVPGHEIALRGPVPAGSFWVAQALPPSMVRIMAPV